MIDIELLEAILRGQVLDSWYIIFLTILFLLAIFISRLSKKQAGKLPEKCTDWGILISALWAIHATQESKMIFFWGHSILEWKRLWAEGFASLCTLTIGFAVVTLELLATCHNEGSRTRGNPTNGFWLGLIWKRLILLALVIADRSLILLSSGWLLILDHN